MRLWRQFDQMRGDHRRTWFRRSDIIDAVRARGCKWQWYEISLSFAGIPRPEKRYGHYRYTQSHMDAALASWMASVPVEVTT